MSQQELFVEEFPLSEVIDTFEEEYRYPETPVHLDLETFLKALGQSESPYASYEEIPKRVLPRKDRTQELGCLLKRVEEEEIPCHEYLSEYLRDQHRRYLSANTLRNSFTSVAGFLRFMGKGGKRDLSEVTREDLNGFIEHEQDRGLKATTVSTRTKSLCAFVRVLIEREVVDPRVLSKRIMIKVPEALPRAMDPEDARRLLSVIEHIRDRAMILVLLRTGMRIGELLDTRVWDVNLQERKIGIQEGEKTGVGRVVYLSDDAREALERWWRRRDPQRSYLFYGRAREAISYPAFRVRFCKYIDKAGLAGKGYTLHCLRHTCATDLLNAGMRLECVQQLLGHSSIEMTRRYARLTDKTREEEYFRAMAIIERGDSDGGGQLDRQLQAVLEKEELLGAHHPQLHEHP